MLSEKYVIEEYHEIVSFLKGLFGLDENSKYDELIDKKVISMEINDEILRRQMLFSEYQIQQYYKDETKNTQYDLKVMKKYIETMKPIIDLLIRKTMYKPDIERIRKIENEIKQLEDEIISDELNGITI